MLSNITDGPYRPGVGHIDPGPYRPGAISTGIRSILGLQVQLAKRGGGSKRGSNFGPNVKKPTSWPKRGGSGPPGPPPPPGSATAWERPNSY